MASKTPPSGQRRPWPNIRGAASNQIRSHEWRLTALGAIESWPQSLKTAVEVMLLSHQPAAVAWNRGFVTLYNDACIPLLKDRHPGCLGKPYWEVWPDNWQDVKPVVEAALDGEPQQLIGQRIRKEDGNNAGWLTWSWLPLRDDEGQITGLFITATETVLQLGDDQFRTILENARDGVFMQDVQTRRYRYASPSLAAMMGFTPDELWNMPESERLTCIHPDDHDAYVKGVSELVSGTNSESIGEYRWRPKNGTYCWFSISRKLVRAPGGRPIAIVGVCRDVTERKKAEEALRNSEKRYRLLHESQRDGFVMVAMDGTILDWNDVYREMLGYSADELRRMTYQELTPERWHKAEADLVASQILPRGYSDIYEKEYRRKDGTIFPVELRAILSRDEAGNPQSMWAAVRDISERKANEAHLQSLMNELTHVGRISEMSQVSAGIAHELNQPLTAMRNYSATAKRMIAAKNEPAAQQAIAKAGEQAERAAEIIRRIRDFVERIEPNPQPAAINDIIKDAVTLGLIDTKADDISTYFALSPGLPDISIDPVQIQQVVIILLRNAIDAMAGSPTRVVTFTSRPHNSGVEVAVADTGCGIPAHMHDSLFRPFVTTKPGGMGFGLSIAKSIIEAHGGTIITAPNPGGGTVFRFSLPARQETT